MDRKPFMGLFGPNRGPLKGLRLKSRFLKPIKGSSSLNHFKTFSRKCNFFFWKENILEGLLCTQELSERNIFYRPIGTEEERRS